MVAQKENKSFFKKGSGEFIGAAVVTPLIFLMVLFIVNVLQISICEQKLIYAAYSCGREAVISYSKEEAQTNASAKLAEIYTNGESVSVSVIPIPEDSMYWIKGNMVIIKIEENLTPVLGLQKGVHARFTVMMVEHSQWTTDQNINY